jgi:exopolyphosphatase/guanosine-5'-triphosphate,3'-diphosphate pyrophosphatase
MNPDRAVIDIGSNTVRLVMYAGSRRAPITWFNEKVSARLGRELNVTGRIPDKAAELALSALRRFAALVRLHRVPEVQVVATAAVRDASNGQELLARIRSTGLQPRLLSGEEEASASACAVVAAFPDALGVVADLGGGSLELISVEGGASHHGVSVPLGTLRLAGLRQEGSVVFRRQVHEAFETAGWAAAHPGPLYMVGGTWRAFATYAMRASQHPLSDPHGFVLPVEAADQLAATLARSDPKLLADQAGLSSMRANALPDAAVMLRAMLSELRPSHLVFSSWGLREGLLHQRLDAKDRARDPLLEGIGEFASALGSSPVEAQAVATWTAAAVSTGNPKCERLRLSAAMLALAAVRIEPNLRRARSVEWALHKRWVGIDMAERAQVAAAMLGVAGKTTLPDNLLKLAVDRVLREANAWGLAIRLYLRLGAGAALQEAGSSLQRHGNELVLVLPAGAEPLKSAGVSQDLETLSSALHLTAAMR